MKPETLMAFGVSQERAEEVAAEIARLIAAIEAEDPKLTDEAIDALRDSADVVDHLTIAAEEMRAAADETDEITVDAIDVRDLVVRARREIKKLRAENVRGVAALAEAKGEIDRLQRMNRALIVDLVDGARPSVAVLAPRGDRFAAICQRKRAGRVELPGGKVEEGEDAETAALREASEELGVPVVGPLVRLGQFLHVVGDVLWHCTAFVANVDGIEPVGGDEGPAVWATRAELMSGSFGGVVSRIFDAYDRAAEGYDANGTPTTETAGGAS